MKCWNCGAEPMSPWEILGKGWYKCSKCGATWSDDKKFQGQKRKAKK